MSELDDLREQVNAEAIARASMDDDLTKIQAKLDMHSGLITAIRETQIQHGHVLAGHTEMLRALTSRSAEHSDRMDRLETGLGHLTTLVETLIERGR